MLIAEIPNAAGTKIYKIRKVGDQLVCDCSDHLFRSKGEAYVCKHLAQMAVEVLTFATRAKKSSAAEAILGNPA